MTEVQWEAHVSTGFALKQEGDLLVALTTWENAEIDLELQIDENGDLIPELYLGLLVYRMVPAGDHARPLLITPGILPLNIPWDEVDDDRADLLLSRVILELQRLSGPPDNTDWLRIQSKDYLG